MLYRRGKVWWYEFQFMGQRLRESSRSASKTVAEAAERQRRRDLEESANGIKKRRRPLLFKIAVREYLDSKRADVKSSTFRIESKNVDHLTSFLGQALLNDIEGTDVARYQAYRVAQGAAGATINLEIGTLRAILRRHRLWANIQPDVKKRPERDDVGISLTRDAETALLAACAQSRSRALLPAVVLALNTGLRSSELLSLRWHQVDLSGASIKVGDSKTKAGRGRVVPMNATAAAALLEWASQFPDRENTHAVFPTERVGAAGNGFGGMISGTDPERPMGSLKEAWESAKRRAGVQVRWHDLRHTCCTRLLETGASLPIVGQILGWSPSTTVRMVQRYGHIGQEAQKIALDRLDGASAPVGESERRGMPSMLH
jgi:integrase